MDPEKWANAKLTIKERGEIKQYIQNGWTLKAVAEMYNVSQNTVMYWSDDEFRAKDIIRASERKKRKMQNPEYAKQICKNRKVRIDKRSEEEPEYNNWLKNGWRENYKNNYTGRTDEQKVSDKIIVSKYYKSHVIEARERGRRSYRSRNLNGFRMFQKHINSVSYADNICHSKKETRSTSSYKSMDVSITKSDLPMVRKLYISLQSILRIMLLPIHALRRGFLNR
jgi:uncharacterized protein YjcR